MNQLPSDIDWNTLLMLALYGLVVILYLIVLKLLMKCIEEMTRKNKTAATINTVVDMDIRQEAANRHADDKDFMFDSYGLALGIVKAFFAVAAIVAVYVIVMLKFNVFVATFVAVIAGIGVWQFREWRKRGGGAKLDAYEAMFTRMGGYNVGTLLLLVLVFLALAAGLIFLPS